MVYAISFLKTVPDQEKAVYHMLRETEGVMSLYHIFGEHDFFLILKTESMTGLLCILNRIKEMGFVSEMKNILVGPASRYGMDGFEEGCLAFTQAVICGPALK
ncbi:MAG TPA: Lrp/AsnC ligand binding domain-containing protein [Methanothrix sp.]|nr:Lrp/AsnC ligand binding domain-containing protein [Methanothrix sp.]HPT37530.1 Lrp/AsnC ligand binding domain-containing protein [Methanothrix sp.]